MPPWTSDAAAAGSWSTENDLEGYFDPNYFDEVYFDCFTDQESDSAAVGGTWTGDAPL